MNYGVVCFALFFSFIGTVLGGLWADDSWGRFWGWDPKENGALMIVLWNAAVLHARWDRWIGPRGFALFTIGGNIVTAWSWFGTNQLGIGLHSYGFHQRRAAPARRVRRQPAAPAGRRLAADQSPAAGTEPDRVGGCLGDERLPAAGHKPLHLDARGGQRDGHGSLAAGFEDLAGPAGRWPPHSASCTSGQARPPRPLTSTICGLVARAMSAGRLVWLPW